MTTRLPVVLENLRIATPCHADWDEMAGDERVRFCGRCEKNVYNLSAMTRAQGEALVRENEGRMCLRLYQRSDGMVLTSDCPVGVKRERLRQRVWARISGVAASAALLVGLWSGRARADLAVSDGKKVTAPQPPRPHAPMMGGAVAKQPLGRLMGQEALLVPQMENKPMMGEPMPILGDIIVETHTTRAATTTTK